MQAADQVRRHGIELPGAMRWLRRRVLLVQQALRVVIGLLPQHLAGCRAELTACRQRLDSQAVLVALRSLAARRSRHRRADARQGRPAPHHSGHAPDARGRRHPARLAARLSSDNQDENAATIKMRMRE